MNVLSIIDKIYESSRFGTFLSVSIILLIILFCIVLFLGIRDKKKAKNKNINVEEEVKDITFDMPTEIENIKEDVTFEMPSLTQNLENFKKNLEEEIQKEEMAEVRKTSGLILPKEKKTIKVLDLDEIEDTAIIPMKLELSEKKKAEIDEADENVSGAIDNFFEDSGEKKNVLDEKIFGRNKDLKTVPILKRGEDLTSFKEEIPKNKELEDLNKKTKLDNNVVLSTKNKNAEQKTVLVSGIGGKNVIKKENNEIVSNNLNKINAGGTNLKQETKNSHSVMYNTDDDF